MADTDATRRSFDLALTSWLDELVSDRRVLWIGDADLDASDRLASRARSLLVLAKNPPPKRESQRRTARISALRPGPLSFRAGSFDVIVVPDLGKVGLAEDGRVGELRDVLGDDGLLVAGTPAAGGDAVGYDRLFELLSDRWRTVRMAGQVPLAGQIIVDFESVGREPEVTFDGSLAGDDQRAERYIAVASDDGARVDAYFVVQLPTAAEVEREAPPAPVDRGRVEELEAALRARRDELDAASEHAETLEGSLAERSVEVERLRDLLDAHEEELGRLRAELERASTDGDTERPPAAESAEEDPPGDYDRLERALAEQGARVLELEREVDRRGTLVRDLVEELRELRAHDDVPAEDAGTSGELEAALDRAMSAEAARAEAQFQIDELMARLAHAGDGAELEGLRTREARLSGTVRGLRSRLAEVEEMRELAEGRLAVAAMDVEEQRRRNRELERQLGELREQLELELVRARGEPGLSTEESERERELRASEMHLSKRVGELSGQLVACRDLALSLTEERDHARADALRLTALVGSLEHRFEGARAGWERRIAELEHDGRVAAGADLAALSREVMSLRGERDGLRYRVRDREEALRVQVAPRVSGSSDDSDRVHRELERARSEAVELSARVADAEDRARSEADRVAELAQNGAARDALVTRLQMDLAREEGNRTDLADRVSRAEQENERLRSALLDASQQVDDAIRDEDHKDRLLYEGRSARMALAETRALLSELSATLGQPVAALRRELTAVGMDAPEPTLPSPRELELERELADQETMIHSLTAQVEDRDDRIRALERRLEGAVGLEGDEEALRRELMELQERAARLSDELLHERRARRAAESDSRKRGNAGEDEVRRLHERLGQSDAELLLLKGQHATSERRLDSIRDAVGQARNNLEELLGSATANGDPATAERIGNVIRLLNRF